MSVFNAQSLITPKAYAAGTTFDKVPAGTGAWKLEDYNQQTGATFERNPDWWGGATPLDGLEFIFFDATGPMVTAYQGQQVDAIIQFDVLSGKSLLDDANFNLIAHARRAASTDLDAHRHGRLRRQARPPGTRPDVRPPGTHPDAVPGQGPARQRPSHLGGLPLLRLLGPAAGQGHRQGQGAPCRGGCQQPDRDPACRASCWRSPTSRPCSRARLPRPASPSTSAVESLDTFYGAQWCPAEPADPPCSGAAELGIVDYGHRGTPDVYLNAALKSKGIWNSSQYGSTPFDTAFSDFQKAVGVDAQKAACNKIETVLLDDMPIGLPYFYNYLAGSSKAFTGVYASGLGQMFFSATRKTA